MMIAILLIFQPYLLSKLEMVMNTMQLYQANFEMFPIQFISSSFVNKNNNFMLKVAAICAPSRLKSFWIG